MMDEENLSKLFFELASDSRLRILSALAVKPLKMQDVARRLDVTATEAFRQLERLSAALLVARQPEGTYALTAYAKLVLQLSSPLDFALKHREYFATHDVSSLPSQFINRLGELSAATFTADTVESLNRGQRLFIEMKQFGWGIAEGVVPELMGPIMDQQLQKGIKMKFIIPKSKLPPNPVMIPNFEVHGLPEIPFVLAVSEKEAMVCLRTNQGKVDYAGFYGSDMTFLSWCRDLFIYFWDFRPTA
jgi:predicted transcriptional regulator